MKAFFERLYDKSDNQFYREMKRNLQEETKMFIITAFDSKISNKYSGLQCERAKR